MSEENRLIQEVPNLDIYFHGLVGEAFKNQKIEENEHVSFYLVNLLSRFCEPEKLYSIGKGEEKPLAILFCEAQQENIQTKAKLLKYLGDFSLFMSGYFQDSLNRKLVDLDYYISMGEGAYSQLSTLPVAKQYSTLFSEIFSTLGRRFSQWVDVLTEVSETCQVTQQSDLLRLYEKFLRTKSDRLKSLLSKQGIFADSRLPTEYSH
ncbi:MAG: hypothetical protein HQM15_10365 [Deltaproteobacteria bacterium]|nr:hypothetical protein [Deltaproteobacteria bacterium]